MTSEVSADAEPRIHPTAVVSDETELGRGVEIGPYCVLSGPVILGDGVRLVGSVYIDGPTRIGPGTQVYPFACIGFPAQDYKFTRGTPTAGVVIGRDCLIREHATIHAATNEHTPTTIGDRVFMMGTTHAAHDVRLGNNVIFVNGAGVAGHVVVGDNVTLSGAAVAHQHVRIGRLAFMSGGVAVSMDVPPFCVVSERNRLGAVNLVGMRRAGIPREHITEVRRAFRDVIRTSVPRTEMLEALTERGRGCPPIAEMAEFVAHSKRGICPGPGRPPRLSSLWIHRSRRTGAVAPADADEADDLI